MKAAVQPFEWKPFSDKQLDFIERSTAKVNIADGPVRSGKTISCLVRWIEYVKAAPKGGDLMLIGKTERTLYRNVISILESMLGPQRCRYNRGTGEFYMLGKVVYCVGANDARAEEKIRGSTLSGAYINEISLIPENAFKQAVARCSVEGSKVFGDTNPDSPYHWLHKDWLANEELIREGYVRRWQFLMDDNLALSEETKRVFRAIYTGLFYKRMILGMWVAAEGAIYDMFDDGTHVVKQLPDGRIVNTYVVGIDYGTSNPTCFLLVAEIDDALYVIDEYWYDSRAKESGRQKTDAEYSVDLQRFIAGKSPIIYPDIEAASFVAQLRKDGVANLRETDKSVLDGIRTVSSMLANNRLFFLEGKCPHTLEEIVGYVWDPAKQKKGEDAPLKQADHAMDALRYAVFNHMRGAPIISAPVTTTMEELAGVAVPQNPAVARATPPPALMIRPDNQ